MSVYSITVVSPRDYTVDLMLLSLGNPIECHEEVLSLQPMIPPKHVDIFFPPTGRRLEGLDAFSFFFKQQLTTPLCGNQK